MKTICVLVTLFLTVPSYASSLGSNCLNDIADDLKYQSSVADDRTVYETLSIDSAKGCVAPKEKGDRKYGCLISGLQVGFVAAAGASTGGISLAAMYGMAWFSEKDVRKARRQTKLNTRLYDFYQNPESEEATKNLRRYFPWGSKNRKADVIREVMAELDESKVLCSKPRNYDDQLKITDDGVEYLKQYGLVPMSLVFDEKEREIHLPYLTRAGHVYIEKTAYGMILTKSELKKKIKEVIRKN